MTKYRKIVYLQDFLDHKKGEIETVDLDMALNLAKQELADILEEKPKKQDKQKIPDNPDLLPVKQYHYWKKLKKDNSFIIEEFLLPGTLNMLFSPPEQYKSLLALFLGLCITNKKLFLGMKTKKCPVLICDKENSQQIIKARIIALKKGLKIRSDKFPLYTLTGEGDLDDIKWVEKLEKTIRHYKIRLIIFDTLHRFSDYEENKADDINKLYTTIFKKLISEQKSSALEQKSSVLFLHHTTKDGKYRGSSDFLGMVDTAYSIRKASNSRTDPKFRLSCEKSRWAGTETINGEFNFDNEIITVKIVPKSHIKAEKIGKISKLREVTAIIKGLFTIKGCSITKREILDHFEIKNLDYSTDDIKHSLRWLVVNEYLDNSKRGKYVRLWIGQD